MSSSTRHIEGGLRVLTGLLLLINAAQLFFVSLVSDQRSYALPHFVLLFALVVLLAFSTLLRPIPTMVRVLGAVCLLATAATSAYALSQGPRGYDSWGTVWMFFAVLPSIVNSVAALCLIAGVILIRRNAQESLIDSQAGKVNS